MIRKNEQPEKQNAIWDWRAPPQNIIFLHLNTKRASSCIAYKRNKWIFLMILLEMTFKKVCKLSSFSYLKFVLVPSQISWQDKCFIWAAVKPGDKQPSFLVQCFTFGHRVWYATVVIVVNSNGTMTLARSHYDLWPWFRYSQFGIFNH